MGNYNDYPDVKWINERVNGVLTDRVPNALEKEQERTRENNPEKYRQAQIDLIDKALKDAEAESIVYNLVSYPGGYETAHMRNNGRDLVKRMIELDWVPLDTGVGFYDTEGKEHLLTLDDANHVILLTAAKYQSDLQKYKSKIVAIREATTVEEIIAIVW